MKPWLKRILFYLAILVLFFVAYLTYLHDDGNSVSKGIPIAQYEETTTALIVVDVQEGTTGEVSTKQYYKDQSSALIRNVNEAIMIANDSGTPVIYIQQQTENWFLNWASGYVTAEGYPGVALDSRLKVVSLNQLPKRIMDAFSNPMLDKLLQSLQVNRLLITGVDVAYCVNKTTQAALHRGYEVWIVEDAVISESDDLKLEKLEELNSKGASLIKTNQLPDLLGN